MTGVPAGAFMFAALLPAVVARAAAPAPVSSSLPPLLSSLAASFHVPCGPWVGDVLVTRGTSAESPGDFEVRYYAPGVGRLKSEVRGGRQEIMELVSGDADVGVP